MNYHLEPYIFYTTPWTMEYRGTIERYQQLHGFGFDYKNADMLSLEPYGDYVELMKDIKTRIEFQNWLKIHLSDIKEENYFSLPTYYRAELGKLYPCLAPYNRNVTKFMDLITRLEQKF